MAPRSFRLVCGPGPGETLLDEGGPASIVGWKGQLSDRMLTCECDGRERNWENSSSKKLSKMTVIPRCNR